MWWQESTDGASSSKASWKPLKHHCVHITNKSPRECTSEPFILLTAIGQCLLFHDHGGSFPCCQDIARMSRANNTSTPKIFRRVELISCFHLERGISSSMGTWTSDVRLILPLASGSISSHCLLLRTPEWTLNNGSKHKYMVLPRFNGLSKSLGFLARFRQRMPSGNGSHQ